MKAAQLGALARNYRGLAQVFSDGDQSGAVIAHHAAAFLLDRAADAVRAADLSCATLEWVGIDLSTRPDMMAVYQPSSGVVAVMTGGQLVIFDEAEAEAIHSAFGEALATRGLAPRLLSERGEAA